MVKTEHKYSWNWLKVKDLSLVSLMHLWSAQLMVGKVQNTLKIKNFWRTFKESLPRLGLESV